MDELKMESVLKSLLESTGGVQDVNQAIDTDDLAATVRAATETLKKSRSIPMQLAERKSAEESNKFRKEGNVLYKNRKYKEAVISYNKSLAYAPNDSQEIILAYKDLSLAMFAIKEYKTCQLIINAALESDCPEYLRSKLEKRQINISKYINLETTRTTISSSDKAGMLNYAKFDVERNAVIPSVSTHVCVDDAKRIVAAKEIKSGTMVALERAFVSVQDEYEEYTSCYYCNKMCFFLVPCKGCCKALFCSKECREKCLEDYHRIECHIVAYMGSMYRRDVNKLAVRAAIKMSLKLSWEKLSVASLKMGEKLLQESCIAEAFDSNSPLSLLCYDDQIEVSSDKMKNASFICAAAVHCLSRVPEYMPEEEEEREKAIDALSRIILHLNTTFLRKIGITSSASDVLDETYRCGAQRNQAWFSFSSKLAHSCEPNLLVLGFNDHVGLVALQRIKKGEPLTISYTEHFYELNLSPFSKTQRARQKQIYEHLQFTCECRVCIREWHGSSQVPGSLTDRQQQAYNLSLITMYCSSFVEKIKAIGAGLDELTGCSNTTQHYNLFGNLRRTLNICQCVKNENKVYGGVSKHYFQILNS